MARIIEIRYEQVHNPKPYETIRVEAKAIVNEGEDPEQAYQELRNFVVSHLERFTAQFWDKSKDPASDSTTVPENYRKLTPATIVARAGTTQIVGNSKEVSLMQEATEFAHSKTPIRVNDEPSNPIFPDDLP